MISFRKGTGKVPVSGSEAQALAILPCRYTRTCGSQDPDSACPTLHFSLPYPHCRPLTQTPLLQPCWMSFTSSNRLVGRPSKTLFSVPGIYTISPLPGELIFWPSA